MKLSGTATADEMLALVKQTIDESGLHPCLAVLQVGEDPASDIYVARKLKVSESVGIDVELHKFAVTTTEELIARVEELNGRADVDAILIQLPLPEGIDTDAVIRTVSPAKDVDGFHPLNIGSYTTGQTVHTPVLIQAIEWLLGKTGASLKGKKAVVVGKSDVFLQPLTYMLSLKGLLVSWVKPQDLPSGETANADVLIVAIGSPCAITADMVKPGAIVIDIGTNRLPDGKVVGDVDYAAAENIASFITPTPGGVGPVTIAALMWNTLRLALERP